MKHLQDLSTKVQDVLEGIIPKEIRFVLIFAEQNGEDMSVASDLTDEEVLGVLTDAIDVIKNPTVLSDY